MYKQSADSGPKLSQIKKTPNKQMKKKKTLSFHSRVNFFKMKALETQTHMKKMCFICPTTDPLYNNAC